MNFHYFAIGTHIHVKVTMHGHCVGILTFTQEEFEEIKEKALAAAPFSPIYSFHEEGLEHPKQAA